MSIEAHFLLLQRGTNDRHKAMKYTSANQSWQFHFVTMSSILLSLFLSRTEKKAFENVCKKHDISNVSIQNQTLSFISSKIGRYLCYLLVRSLAYAAGGLEGPIPLRLAQRFLPKASVGQVQNELESGYMQ